MNKVTLCAVLIASVAASVIARPEPNHRSGPHRPNVHRPAPRPPKPVLHRPAPRPIHKPSRTRWSVDVSPWGSFFSINRRVGHHGNVSLALPLVSTPVVREEKTIVVQQPIVVQQVGSNDGVELNTIYAENTNGTARTWVEGYWKVTRSPDGREANRVWIPGHWE